MGPLALRLETDQPAGVAALRLEATDALSEGLPPGQCWTAGAFPAGSLWVRYCA